MDTGSGRDGGEARRWLRRVSELRDQLQRTEENAARAEAMSRRAEEAERRRLEAEERLAEEIRLRTEAEARLAENTIDRQAVEASVRHNAELVEHALQERLAAEHRAAELARTLVSLRESVIEAIRAKGSRRAIQQLELALAATRDVETPPAPAPASAPAPAPAATSPVEVPDSDVRPVPPAAHGSSAASPDAEPADPGRPADPAEAGEAGAPASGRVRTASAWLEAARMAESGELPRMRFTVPDVGGTATDDAGPGPADAGRRGEPVDDGPVTVSEAGRLRVRKGSREFGYDLTDERTEVRVLDGEDQPRWRLAIEHPDVPRVIVDDRMTDPDALLTTLRRWRPGL